MLTSEFSNKEYFDLCRSMEQYHSVFETMWSMGKPSFTSDIPTAAVAFDKDGKYIDFLFNPEFWGELSEYEKIFIICHECLHVILSHGLR